MILTRALFCRHRVASLMSAAQPPEANGDLDARAGVYELLSRLWLYEVDTDLLAELTDGSLADGWKELDGPAIEASQLDDLATEYCRLFVGPRDHVAPFQSVWQTGQHGSEAVASMNEYLEMLSEPVEKLREIPDHLGVQLLMMGVFLRCVAKAPTSQDLRDLTTTFFAEHLSWPDAMLTAAVEKSELPFYRFLIEATADFLRGESLDFAAPS